MSETVHLSSNKTPNVVEARARSIDLLLCRRRPCIPMFVIKQVIIQRERSQEDNTPVAANGVLLHFHVNGKKRALARRRRGEQKTTSKRASSRRRIRVASEWGSETTLRGTGTSYTLAKARREEKRHAFRHCRRALVSYSQPE